MLNARLSLPVLVAVAGEVFFFVSSALFYPDDFHRIDISALNQPRFRRMERAGSRDIDGQTREGESAGST